MRRILLVTLLVLAIPVIALNLPVRDESHNPKKPTKIIPRIISSPERVELPLKLEEVYGGRQMLGAGADTFILGEWDFDDGTAMGWTTADLTEQKDTFFHVADLSELDGGNYGTLFAISGVKSLWCGLDQTSESPFCHWDGLPGYGHNWNQLFESQVFIGDTMTISYKIKWDMEEEYDRGYCQYLEGGVWIDLPVNSGREYYHYYGSAVEAFTVVPSGGSTRFRFKFVSDDSWDGEDGDMITDGALIIDDISVSEILIAGPAVPLIVGSPVGWTGSGERIAVSGNHVFVTKGGDGVQSVDISDPENPVLRGTYDTPGTAYGIAVDGDYAYVADEFTLQVLDISDPDNPSYAGSASLYLGGGFNGWGIAVSGSLAYVAQYHGIEVFDISTPFSPSRVNILFISGVRDIAVAGSYAYVVGGANGLDVLSLSNPAYPTVAGSLSIWAGTSYSVAVDGNYAYLACGPQDVGIVDISNPTAPFLAGGHITPGESNHIAIKGDSLFVADGTGGLVVIDISNPLDPVDAGSCSMPSSATGLTISGDYFFVVAQTHGPQSVKFVQGTSHTAYFEDFEGEDAGAKETDDGLWAASVGPPFGNYAALHVGSSVLQEDPCEQNETYLWGFFDDSGSTNYSCGGHPEQGAMPYGPDELDYYLNNILISPPVPLTDSGSSVRLRFSVYRDLPLDNLQFYYFMVRSLDNGCTEPWHRSEHIYHSDLKDWYLADYDIGEYYIDPGVDTIQVAIGAWDSCPLHCGVYGTGSCHSHAPLIDDISVVRIDLNGPSFALNHYRLFQDNFPADGTVTGTARADMALDRHTSASPLIQPGDSIVISVDDMDYGLWMEYGRAAVRAYIRRHGHEGDHSSIVAPESRPGLGDRYPYIEVDGDYCIFSMDTVFTDNSFTTPVNDEYCFDLNDAVLVPGDSVSYFFGAMNSFGEWNYCSRSHDGQGSIFITDDIEEVKASPMEFCILPTPGRDILYVDDTDDRGGPVQAYFDAAFDSTGIAGRVDRYDVLGPTSLAVNGLSSRVMSMVQLSGYDAIIWSSGTLETGLIGEGEYNMEKPCAYELLHLFLNRDQRSGLYVTGDNIAEEWDDLVTSGSAALRSDFMNFDLVSDDHVSAGEPVSPRLYACGSVFDTLSPLDSILAYGGCPTINNFDVLGETGNSMAEMMNPAGGAKYVLSQQTVNDSDSLAGVILSGFSFHELRDDYEQYSAVQQARHMLMIMEWLLDEDLGDIESPHITDSGEHVPEYSDYLSQNFPNPFNPVTTIQYGVKKRGPVSLRIYDVSGRLVRTLVDSTMEPGDHRAVWDGRSNSGRNVTSGIYFARILITDYIETKKLVLLR